SLETTGFPPSGPINLTNPPLESVGSEPATDPTISLWSLPFFTMFLSMDLVGMEGSGEISSFELQFMHIPRLRIYYWKLLFSLYLRHSGADSILDYYRGTVYTCEAGTRSRGCRKSERLVPVPPRVMVIVLGLDKLVSDRLAFILHVGDAVVCCCHSRGP
ncbi:hypothetical protein Tco_0881640, partial [Tanacetum coccineum]